ncbi:MAG: DNA-binding response regulator [Dehalococcoidia bacterium]|nr:DNA-binding response regulator [Dehalococcoidia bacterium]MQG16517.1 response regulator transcription factor [SAR202 cluster bacterium]|tara:strand:+ start:23942 stop:24655 length:714 start_codon:yes stop_codon:yes gene_type:complete
MNDFERDSKTILVVEDDPNIQEALRYSLEKEGYRLVLAKDGDIALTLAQEQDPDLVLLDIMLPGIDGLSVCKSLRVDNNVPIIMLTAKTEEIDKVLGLELGADDYITKPFSMRELIARIKVQLRHSNSKNGNLKLNKTKFLNSGNLTVDTYSHTAKLNGSEINLRPREFNLLSFFMHNKGKALTRLQILEALWGHDYIGDTRTVDVHIRWLRQKLESNPEKPIRIVTVRGIGYRFDG